MANQAATNQHLGTYTEAEMLEIQIPDIRNRILGVEHWDKNHAMPNLAATYECLEKYTEAEKLVIQVLDTRGSFDCTSLSVSMSGKQG